VLQADQVLKDQHLGGACGHRVCMVAILCGFYWASSLHVFSAVAHSLSHPPVDHLFDLQQGRQHPKPLVCSAVLVCSTGIFCAGLFPCITRGSPILAGAGNGDELRALRFRLWKLGLLWCCPGSSLRKQSGKRV
jgi:hypothetical protein